MENAIISLICCALMIIGSAGLATSALHSADTVSGSWKEMARAAQEKAGTRITVVDWDVPEEEKGAVVKCWVRNDGAVSLGDFGCWDVIVQYGDGGAVWLPPGAGAPGWTEAGITYQGSPEVFEPGILNPGERALLLLQLSPAVSPGSTNRVTISTANGVTAERMFQR